MTSIISITWRHFLRSTLCAGAMAGATVASAAPPVSWQAISAEMLPLTRLSGDAARGEQAYRGCRGCHRADGAGRSDGTYPRLAGQHPLVILKQVTDTRAGRRVNPKMGPFASEHAVTDQELVDISVFLAQARPAVENGKGDAAAAAQGAKLYAELQCDTCHGRAGEGHADKVYPAVAAQHYGYQLRELLALQGGGRGNAHPDMVRSIKSLGQADLQALASYLSHLPDPRAPRR